VLGHRRDGRPIFPILGADERDPSNTSVTQEKTFTQDQVSALLAREKQQGGRAAVKEVLEQLGFAKTEELISFVQTQRQAEAAALSEVQRREREAEQKALEAERRLAEAASRERAAVRRAALVGLGATGDDLVDAEALLKAVLPDDADEQAVQEAAEALKQRRPSLFGAAPVPPPAPGGSPAGGAPRRMAPMRPGQAGIDMARRRGYISE
jgi:hypothetical protein